MQEQMGFGATGNLPWSALPGQSLAALLALVGAKRLDGETLRGRTKLAPYAFVDLLDWLQREHLVDVVASVDGDSLEEKIELTERGESVLVSLLEKTCELPEIRQG